MPSRQLATICHAVPPRFGLGAARADEADDPPTYYEALAVRMAAGEPAEVLERVFRLANADGPGELPPDLAGHAADVARYRELGNRSLSVGDVVVLTPDEGRSRAWVCAPLGWHPLDAVPEPVPTPPGATRSAARAAHDAHDAH